MRIDDRFLNWGVFFILLGAVPLAVQAGVVDRDVVARAWQLWPLLIVAAGAGLLLRSTPWHWVGGLVAAATFGLMLGSLLAVGSSFASLAGSCGGGSATTAFPAQQGSLAGTAQVKVEFNCGDLAIQSAGGAAWVLNGTTDQGQAPRVDASANSLTLRSRDTGIGFLGFGSRQSWNLALPQDPSIDLDLTMNAASGRIGLPGTHLGVLEIQGNAGSSVVDVSTVAALRQLTVTFNAGSVKIAMPNASLTGSFQVNAGSVGFCVPEGVGLRIVSSDNVTASNNFGDQGLVKAGNVWQSANFSSATNRIDLTANANAGSLTLNPKEGCG